MHRKTHPEERATKSIRIYQDKAGNADIRPRQDILLPMANNIHVKYTEQSTGGNGLTEIITFRLSVTGVWQYEFCLDGETVGNVASVVSLREPARIEGRNLSWYSRFDMDADIVPGVSRKVKDNLTGEEVYRIVWWRPNLYEVRTKKSSVQVEIRNGSYLFGDPMRPVMALTERVSGESRLVRGMEAEKWFRTVFFEPVSDGYMMMTLSFPALRFC